MTRVFFNSRERVVSTSQKQTEVVIPSLQPSTTYHFRVIAHNSRGPGSSSEVLRVTTHSEVRWFNLNLIKTVP